jgi:hypothetical protein
VLAKAAQENPDDADIEVALGNALVGHSEGLITPAAQYAFRRAAEIDPTHPGPPFFMGLAMAQSGRLADARALWADLLARAPADAPYRQDLAMRLMRLDQMMGPRAKRRRQPGANPARPPRHRQPARLRDSEKSGTACHGWRFGHHCFRLGAGAKRRPDRFYCGPDGTIWPAWPGAVWP